MVGVEGALIVPARRTGMEELLRNESGRVYVWLRHWVGWYLVSLFLVGESRELSNQA